MLKVVRLESLQFVMQFCFTNFVYLIKNILCFLLTVCLFVNLSLGCVCFPTWLTAVKSVFTVSFQVCI